MPHDRAHAQNPLFHWPGDVLQNVGLADSEAVTTFIIGPNGPVISSTCVLPVSRDVKQDVKQERVAKNGA